MKIREKLKICDTEKKERVKAVIYPQEKKRRSKISRNHWAM